MPDSWWRKFKYMYQHVGMSFRPLIAFPRFNPHKDLRQSSWTLENWILKWWRREMEKGHGEGLSCNHKEKLKIHYLWIPWSSLSFQIVVKAFMALIAMAAMALKSIECSSSICTFWRADLLQLWNKRSSARLTVHIERIHCWQKSSDFYFFLQLLLWSCRWSKYYSNNLWSKRKKVRRRFEATGVGTCDECCNSCVARNGWTSLLSCSKVVSAQQLFELLVWRRWQ